MQPPPPSTRERLPTLDAVLEPGTEPDLDDTELTRPLVGRSPALEPLASDVEPTRPLPARFEAPTDPTESDTEYTRPLPTRPAPHAEARASRAPSAPVSVGPIIALTKRVKSDPPPPAPVAVFTPARSRGIVESVPSVQVHAASPADAPGSLPRRKSGSRQVIAPAVDEPRHRNSQPTLPPMHLQAVTRASVPPVAASVPPPPVSSWSFRHALMAAALLAFVPLVAFGMAHRPGSLLVTAAATDGRAPGASSVAVDGVLRCETVPCEVSGLSPGAHLVRVSAPGFSRSAERAIELAPGGHAAHHVTLLSESPEPLPAPTSPAVKDEPAAPVAATVSRTELAVPMEMEQLAAPVPEPTKAAPRRSSSAGNPRASKIAARVRATEVPAQREPATQSALLDIVSTPPAAVVVNGRPLGHTPLRGVRVEPGPQAIVFIHPDLGRKVVSTVVSAGRRSVSMSF